MVPITEPPVVMPSPMGPPRPVALDAVKGKVHPTAAVSSAKPRLPVTMVAEAGDGGIDTISASPQADEQHAAPPPMGSPQTVALEIAAEDVHATSVAPPSTIAPLSGTLEADAAEDFEVGSDVITASPQADEQRATPPPVAPPRPVATVIDSDSVPAAAPGPVGAVRRLPGALEAVAAERAGLDSEAATPITSASETPASKEVMSWCVESLW